MKANILQDEKGYKAQINCNKVFDNCNGVVHVLAGEDGLISVRHKNKNGKDKNMNGDFIMLGKMTNSEGFLTHIEDVCILENGDLVVVCVDGDIGQYVCSPNNNYSNQKDNNYKLKRLVPPAKDDCLYYISANTDSNSYIKSVTVWGEKNIEYIVVVD